MPLKGASLQGEGYASSCPFAERIVGQLICMSRGMALAKIVQEDTVTNIEVVRAIEDEITKLRLQETQLDRRVAIRDCS